MDVDDVWCSIYVDRVIEIIDEMSLIGDNKDDNKESK